MSKKKQFQVTKGVWWLYGAGYTTKNGDAVEADSAAEVKEMFDNDELEWDYEMDDLCPSKPAFLDITEVREDGEVRGGGDSLYVDYDEEEE